jgi:hypothetical protein
MAFAAPHAFHLYDHQAVQIGTKTATALTSDTRDLDVYDELFNKLEAAAVFDDEARDAISTIAAKYR